MESLAKKIMSAIYALETVSKKAQRHRLRLTMFWTILIQKMKLLSDTRNKKSIVNRPYWKNLSSLLYIKTKTSTTRNLVERSLKKLAQEPP